MAAREPRVTVGMPAYNAEPWIGRAIESLLRQTLTDFELIISDNASSDSTRAISHRFARRDRRIRVIENARNRGLASNYNRVFQEARAPYFKWASSNDACHPRLLERCLEALEQRPEAALAYPGTILCYSDPPREEPCPDELDLDCPCPVERFKRFLERVHLNNLMNGLFRTNALRGTALIQPYLASDVVLMAEVLLRGPFVAVPEHLFYRSMNTETATMLKSRQALMDQWNPGGDGMLFQPWHGQWGYLRAIMLAPVSHGEKLELFRYVLRGIVKARHRLWRDAVFSTRELVTGRRANG